MNFFSKPFSPSDRTKLVRKVVAQNKWLVTCAIEKRQTHSYWAWWTLSQQNWMPEIWRSFEVAGGTLPLDNSEIKSALDYVSTLRCNVLAAQQASAAGINGCSHLAEFVST